MGGGQGDKTVMEMDKRILNSRWCCCNRWWSWTEMCIMWIWMGTLPLCTVRLLILLAEDCDRYIFHVFWIDNNNTIAFTLVFNVVTVCVVWPIGSEPVLNASWVHLHVYIHVVKLYPIAIQSSIMHFNVRFLYHLCRSCVLKCIIEKNLGVNGLAGG